MSGREHQYDLDVTERRIVAGLVDVAVLFAVFLVMAAGFGESGSTETAAFNASLSGGGALLYFVVVLTYYAGAEGVTGTTPGKRITGRTVVKVDGSRYEWGAVSLRNVLRIVDGLPVLCLVGIISVSVTERNQRLGDLAAKTVVVRR